MREEYDRLVNNKWKALPPEMAKNVDKEYAAKFVKKAWRAKMKTKFPFKIAYTSGNRNTWVRGMVCYINTEKGWDEIVHLWSHFIGRRKRLKPHSNAHLVIERDFTDLAIAEFVGKMSETKPKASGPEKRAESVRKRIEAWEKKLNRAKNALKKLNRQKAYYDKTLGSVGL
jgi:hypothetical protein